MIRQVRGKPLLEALYRLQQGRCAYDEERCALLLPLPPYTLRELGVSKDAFTRFATVDHVVPRSIGGENKFSNLVMASQISNSKKGALAPTGLWIPKIRHTHAEVEAKLKLVEQHRWVEATKLAEMRKFSKQFVFDYLFQRELRRLQSSADFKFYENQLEMVA